MPITINSVTGIQNFVVEITFDASKVSYSSVSITNSILSGFSVEANVVSTGRLRISGAGAQSVSGPGMFLDVFFRDLIGAAGSSTLSIGSNIRINDGAITATVDNTTIAIWQLLLKVPETITGAPLLRFTYPINVETIAGLNSFTLDVKYNSSILSVHSVSTLRTVLRGFLVESNVVSPGVLRIAGAGTPAAADSGKLVEVVFDVASSASGSSTISLATNANGFNAGQIGVKVVNSTALSISEAAISFPADTSISRGGSISIPILVSDITNRNYTSFQFDVDFDNTALTFTGVTTTGTVTSGITPQVNTTTGVVAGSGSAALSGSGIFIWLNFTISSTISGAKSVQVKNFKFNELNPYTTITRTLTAPTGSAPTISLATTSFSAAQGKAFSAQMSATDPDGDAITFSVTGAPAGLIISAAGLISGASTQSGTFTMTLTATDATGLTDTEILTLTVAANNPPTISPSSITLNGTTGQNFNYVFTVADPDNDSTSITFSEPLPAGLTIGATGILTGIPTSAGDYPIISITVSDGRGGTASSAVHFIIIEGANVAPVVASDSATVQGTVGTAISYTIIATDANGEIVNFSYTGTFPTGVSGSTAGIISGTPTQSGTFPITVIATDTKSAKDTAKVTLVISPITAANHPPVIAFDTLTVPGTTGQALTHTISATDADNDTITFTYSGTFPTGITATDKGVISGTPTASGSFPIIVYAADTKGGRDTANVTLSISIAPAVNNPPVFSQSEIVLTANAGLPLLFNAGELASDPDAGDTKRFTMTVTPATSTIVIDSTTGIISWLQTVAGTYVLNVQVRDKAGLTASLRINLTVSGDIAPPVIVQRPTVSGITNSGAVIQITANEPVSALVRYRTAAPVGSFLEIIESTLRAAQTVIITGLQSDTQYQYRVVLTDAAGNRDSTELFDFKTLAAADTVKPVILSGPIVQGISNIGATITWETNEVSSSFVDYGTDSLTTSSAGGETLDKNHSVTLANLTSGTRYFYRIRSTDASGNTFTGRFRTFTTSIGADVTPPIFLMGPLVQSVTGTTALIAWQTNESSTSKVYYRTGAGALYQTTASDALTLDHSITLTGLEPGDSYEYFVESADGSANIALSDTFAFATLETADEVPPLLVTDPVVTGITENQAIIAWVTDETGDSYVNFGIDSAYGQTNGSPEISSAHKVTLTNLSSGTTYHFQVTTTDPSGNTMESGDHTFATLSEKDATPPAIIEGPIVKAVSNNTATIEWTTDEASTSIILYGTTEQLGTTFERPGLIEKHVLTLTQLSNSTAYYYKVQSADASGNETSSDVYTFNTRAEADTSAPLIVQKANVVSLTGNSAVIEWHTNKISDSKVSFGETEALPKSVQDGETVKKHSMTLTNLLPNQKYYYQVSSRGLNGKSVSEELRSFTTPQTTAAMELIFTKEPVVSDVTNNSAVIEWQTNANSTSIVEYTKEGGSAKKKTDPALVTNHKIILTNLDAAAFYSYLVTSVDIARKEISTAGKTLQFYTKAGRDSLPPDIVQIPYVSEVSGNSATIKWKTNEPSNSTVEYGTDATYALGPLQDGSNVINHSVLLTGLAPGTQYFAYIKSVDVSGNTRSTANNPIIFTTKTSVTTVPPQILRGPDVAATTTTTATIEWQTDKLSDSFIKYGLSRENLDLSIGSAELVNTHSFVLSNLTPNQLYHFTVSSTDLERNVVETSRVDYTFRTKGADDTRAPVIVEGPIVYSTERSAAFRWVTDEPANTIIYFKEDDPNIVPEKVMDPELVTNHSMMITNLKRGVNYIFVLASIDFSGNTITFPSPVPAGFGTLYKTLGVEMVNQPPGGDGRFRTSQRIDTQKPVIVKGPILTNKTSSTVSIYWKTDEPSNSFIEYGGTSSYGESQGTGANSIEHTITLTNLSRATTYNYRVSSTDINLNGPSYSGNSAITTNSEEDLIPPIITSAAQCVVVLDDQATIMWETDEPSDSKIEYALKSDFATDINAAREEVSLSEDVLVHKITVTNLISDTVYYYRVSSIDLNNNGPTYGKLANFRTEAGKDTDPPDITEGPTVASVTDSTATITWNTSELSDSFVRFDTTSNVQKRIALGKTVQDPSLFANNVGEIQDVTEHELAITGLTPSMSYSFSVGSTDKSNNGSQMTPVATFETAAFADRTAPEIPSGVSAEAGNQAVYVAWAAVADTAGDLAGYNVYRDEGSGLSLIASNVTDTSYYDFGIDNDKAYTYAVSSIDKVQPYNESDKSASISSTPTATSIPTNPALSAPASDYTFTQTNMPTFTLQNATSTRTPVTYELIIATDSLFLDVVHYEKGIAEGTGSITTHTMDVELENGSYYWRARAYDGFFAGPWMDASTFNVDFVTSVELSVFEFSDQGGKVELNWETTVEENNAGFYIERSLSANEGFVRITDKLIESKIQHEYTYYDENVRVGETYYYRLIAVALSGSQEMLQTVMVTVSAPKEFQLHQNYPNPFNPVTHVRFEMPKSEKVILRIYNILGQEIKTLLDKNEMEAGYHTIQWDGTNNLGVKVASGVYIYRIQAGKFIQSKKMLFMK